MRPCLKIFVTEEEIEEAVEVPFDKSHQASNITAAPLPLPPLPPPHPPILKLNREKMVKNECSGSAMDWMLLVKIK